MLSTYPRSSSVRRVQVCVIGSGAGGGVAAAKLAERGIDTLLLEQGEYHPADTLTQNEQEMFPRLFQEEGRRATADLGVSILQGCSLGGGTYHNTGLCMTADETLWEEWRARGATPGDYAEYAAYAGGVLGAIQARPALEEEVNTNNRLLETGAKTLGWRSFRAMHNRIRCSGCGFCTLGCAYNRKLSIVHAFLPRAVAAGLEIWTRCRARRIEQLGARSFRVRCTVPLEGPLKSPSEGACTGEIDLLASAVIIAAGAVDTPLLIGASRLSRSPALGNNLRLHPFAPVGGVFAHDVIAWRGVPQTVLIDEHAGGAGGFHLMAAAAQPAVTAMMSAARGDQHRQIMTRYRSLAVAGVLLADSSAGSVTAGWGGAPKIRYWSNGADIAGFRRGIRALAELMIAAGAEQVLLPFTSSPVISTLEECDVIERLPFQPHSVRVGSVHPQGTCAMGTSAACAVTDSNGEVHGMRGVFVADASLFPSSLGVPPQVTIMALAWRLADYLHANRSRYLS